MSNYTKMTWWRRLARLLGFKSTDTHVVRVAGKVIAEYTPGPARPYQCTECGAQGVRLWREVHDSTGPLRCCACSMKKEKVTKYDPKNPYGGIGSLLAARPVDDTFYGQCGGPQESVDWWFSLPLEEKRP